MTEQFGKTWWGEHWLRSLEIVDYDNRLPLVDLHTTPTLSALRFCLDISQQPYRIAKERDGAQYNLQKHLRRTHRLYD